MYMPNTGSHNIKTVYMMEQQTYGNIIVVLYNTAEMFNWSEFTEYWQLQPNVPVIISSLQCWYLSDYNFTNLLV